MNKELVTLDQDPVNVVVVCRYPSRGLVIRTLETALELNTQSPKMVSSSTQLTCPNDVRKRADTDIHKRNNDTQLILKSNLNLHCYRSICDESLV